MKKILKLISISLLIALVIFAFSSCGPILYWPKINYPDGYTGGFSYHLGDYPQTEYHWVETYDEAVAAMELLKSHGSTFVKTAIFSYEGDLFDTKYCIKISSNQAEFVQFGEDPFDRQADNVEILSYGFFEDVSIDELVYSFVIDYDALYFSSSNLDFKTGEDIDPSTLTIDWIGEHSRAFVSQDKTVLFDIHRAKKDEKIELSDEYVNIILNSLVIVGE